MAQSRKKHAPRRPKAWKYTPEDLRGKHALVTGGTSGIGRSLTLLLAAEGANVLTFGRHQDKLDDTLDQGSDLPGQVSGVIADQTKRKDLARVFDEVDERLGQLDILVNNASLPAGSVVDADCDEIEYILKGNLQGYMVCVCLAAERMIARSSGHIVNIGSMSAEVFDPRSDLYVATKSGVRGFSGSLRKRINEEGIKVSLVEPGLVGSSMSEDRSSQQQRRRAEQFKELYAEDVAECVYFCLTQPRRADVVMMQVRAHQQII
ncbi:MAG: SDR family oxidoreductase [Phycisphaerae bacterium]